jgi:eukaryotic translation initiation factor 2-alpha kinase 4
VPVNQPPLTRRFSAVTGHPRVSKAAVFDIITPDLENGPLAASAEVLTLVNDCLKSFPNLAENYEVHISHSKSRI